MRLRRLAEQIPGFMATAAVPGLSLGIIKHGQARLVRFFGVRDIRDAAAVDEHTVFEAASLSKPVFAYAVLKLVEAGVISLDYRLCDCVPDYLPNDPRAKAITVRHVLSHTSGLPNWRRKEYPLKTYFAPGDRFSYSGEGFLYLQKVVETICGSPLDRLMHELVLGPLRMHDSSYVWDARFAGNFANPHDSELRPLEKFRPSLANAAFTLHTTASDYCRFLAAAVMRVALSEQTHRLWFDRAISVDHPGIESFEVNALGVDIGVDWTLGWGVERESRAFFHWGANDGFTAFTIGSLPRQEALVLFANGDGSTSTARHIVEGLFPGERSSLTWLGW